MLVYISERSAVRKPIFSLHELSRKLSSALVASSLNYVSARLARHSFSESVYLISLSFFRL